MLSVNVRTWTYTEEESVDCLDYRSQYEYRGKYHQNIIAEKVDKRIPPLEPYREDDDRDEHNDGTHRLEGSKKESIV